MGRTEHNERPKGDRREDDGIQPESVHPLGHSHGTGDAIGWTLCFYFIEFIGI